ncbi:HAD family hydrolase [Saccharothrix sp. Mg75]|uniref:HAD family hydrolase n=1 Tax=Saccharothrix sp. Mg75 TaxID=3445357 RepID=UPI003EE86C45
MHPPPLPWGAVLLGGQATGVLARSGPLSGEDDRVPPRRRRGVGSAPGIRVAVLDVDGTLVEAPLPAMSADAGLAARDRLTLLRWASATGEPEDSVVAGRLHGLFAAMLTGVACRAVSAVAARMWSRQRRRVFPFAAPLVVALKDAGYLPALISGGPEELAACLAVELGVELFRGTRFETADGPYTGRVASWVLATKDAMAARSWPGARKWA